MGLHDVLANHQAALMPVLLQGAISRRAMRSSASKAAPGESAVRHTPRVAVVAHRVFVVGPIAICSDTLLASSSRLKLDLEGIRAGGERPDLGHDRPSGVLLLHHGARRHGLGSKASMGGEAGGKAVVAQLESMSRVGLGPFHFIQQQV